MNNWVMCMQFFAIIIIGDKTPCMNTCDVLTVDRSTKSTWRKK